MRISPKQLLHGLLYLAPVTLLALASCGGGGGGGSNTTLASYYTLSVSVAGISGVTGTSGVVLRNGGDTMNPIIADGTYKFEHSVLSGSTYNISVLTQPTTSPGTQVCSVAGPVATMPASAKTVVVSCVTGYTISGTVTGGTGNVVLQNNSDNLVVNSNGGTFNFTVASGKNYDVTVLTNPPGYQCTSSISGSSIGGNVSGSIACTAISAGTTPPDQHVYVANSGSNTAWTYTANGTLSGHSSSNTLISPSAIAVFGGKYAFVTNRSSNYVSAYSVTSGVLSVNPIANTATGNTPVAIAVHPTGKFVYVVNQLSNSISAYSITSTGTLAAIDADAITPDMQPSISTGTAYIPVAITINPAGDYAYVASQGDGTTNSCGNVPATGCITAYSIDQTTGALTQVPISGVSHYIATGTKPSSIAVDSTYVYVTNIVNKTVSVYSFSGGSGELVDTHTGNSTGLDPYSIAINPVSPYVYVANTGDDSVSVFSSAGGTLTTYPTGLSGGQPVSISVDSTGQYVYVANSGTNNISVFPVNGATLGAVLGPYGAGINPVSITTGP